jgi:hypothetical protein
MTRRAYTSRRDDRAAPHQAAVVFRYKGVSPRTELAPARLSRMDS